MEPPRDLLLTFLQYPDTSLTEDEILLLWMYLSSRLKGLSTSEGRRVQVRDAGSVDRSTGPDVRNATLILNGVRRTGAVEIHRQTADWYAHEHHRDEGFNTVILHVVLTGEDEPVRRQDDQWVDTLVLEPHLPVLQSTLRSELGPSIEKRRRRVKRPCYREDPDESTFRETLGSIGMAWMTKRAALFREHSRDRFLRELIGALGYSRNHGAFDRLARRIRFGTFRDRLRQTHRTNRLEGLLLGRGGWFAEDRRFNRSIERRRQRWTTDWSGSTKRVDTDRWRRSGVRPHVRPVRRWIALGWATHRVLQRFDSWADWCRNDLVPVLKEKSRPAGIRQILSEVFRLPGGNYWNHHYSLGDDPHDSVPSPVGSTWFDQLLVNLIVPYLYFVSIRDRDEIVRDCVNETLRRMSPSLTNRRTRRVTRQWGFDNGDFDWKNALQQQGAIHLYKSGCRADRCDQCPFRNETRSADDQLFEKSR